MRLSTLVIVAIMVSLAGLCASAAGAGSETVPQHWDVEGLMSAPETYPVEMELLGIEAQPANRNPEHAFTGQDVEAIFYEGLPWQGKPTRVFAWYAVPEVAEGEKVPGMVLVHGGGGTAFDEWVRIWNRRGYAAIAMDLTGSHPGGKPGQRPRHEWAGPPHHNMSGVDDPVEDQWVYHAVADVILAHSLLRSFPEVDGERIGMTGISWGGFLSGIVPAIDHRFAFAIPVYGCGHLTESPAWAKTWQDLGPERSAKWFGLWDPAHYVRGIGMPTLWVNGANDRHFPLSIHGKTFGECGGEKRLCVRVGLGHSHVAGWEPPDIYAFAGSMVGKGPARPRLGATVCKDGIASAPVLAKTAPLGTPTFIYTTDVKDWVACEWATVAAEADASGENVSAPIPENARACFFNLTSEDGLVISSRVAVPD